MSMAPYTTADLEHSPLLVFYEVTQACDLKCQHCRASAQPLCHPGELTTAQARMLIDELREFPRTPLLVLTGGDPLKRQDVVGLVRYAVERQVEVAMTPSATPLLTADAISQLKDAGLARFAVSLDGADAVTHDGFRGVAGSFARTLQAIGDARRAGLPVQVNTTVARHNVDQIDAIAELLAGMDIVLWSVFFLIPTGRAVASARLSADECELAFTRLHSHVGRQPYAIKTTEAPHYRRFQAQQARAMSTPRPGAAHPMRPVGTNDGKGVMFVGHRGEIYPSGFLPKLCGWFPADSLVETYQQSPLFVALRDADRLGGKCGVCEYRNICGGSRARAYALTGDPLAAEVDCAYVPVKWRKEEAACSA